MSLRDELQAIYDQHSRLTPSVVVDVARDEAHPLHGRFEWNDALAGEAHRRRQASDLIRSVRVTYRAGSETEEARSVRYFHAVRDEQSLPTYAPVDVVTQDPKLLQMVMQEMHRDWQALRRRYSNFSEFRQMVLADVEKSA